MTVSEDAAAQWKGKGPASTYPPPGEQVPVDALLHGIATVSANDAAIVLAQGAAGSVPAWTARMNGAARRLGMRHSAFNTPNGWPDEGRTYVSAFRSRPAGQRDDRPLSGALPPATRPEGHDVGRPYPSRATIHGRHRARRGRRRDRITREAGYNFLGSASRDGRRLVMTVVAGARSDEQRAVASRALLNGASPPLTRGRCSRRRMSPTHGCRAAMRAVCRWSSQHQDLCCLAEGNAPKRCRSHSPTRGRWSPR